MFITDDLNYTILEGASPLALVEHVNMYIKAGYEPVGGITIDSTGGVVPIKTYYQVMYLKAEEEPNA